MNKNLFRVFVVCILLSVPIEITAQDRSAPPKVLQIFREEIKPGKGTIHEKVEAGYARSFSKAKWPTHYLGMTGMTGAGEAWFLVGYDSFAALEKDQAAVEKNPTLRSELEQLDQQDGELRTGQHDILAIYREDLSYKPNADLSQKRYLEIITFRVRIGHDADFTQAVKIVRDAYEQVRPEFSWGVYQVTSGAPAGTYLVLVPLKSLEELDAGLARAKALQEAEGEENVKKMQKLGSEGFLSTETNIFSLSPKMSYVPKEWAASDPDFWTPKPKAAAKPMPAPAEPGKEAPKPAASKGAAKGTAPKQ